MLQGVTTQGPRFDAVMIFDNPNGFDVQVRTVRANVRIGTSTIPVLCEPNVWIPADGAATVAVPVTVPWGAVPALATQVAVGAQIRYTIVGNADVTASRALEIDRNAYSFNEEGVLPQSIFVQSTPELPLTLGVGTPGR